MSLLSTSKIEDITADALLAIADNQPEKLFTAGNADQIKKEYRQLAKIWHSDHTNNPKATEVMQRIQALYSQANDKVAQNKWEIPNLLRFETTDHKRFQIRYLKKQGFELGDMYIADASVTYVLPKTDDALFKNAKNTITGLRYPNDDMKRKFKSVLPDIKRTFETPDSLIMMVDKNPNAIQMKDVIRHFGGKVDPKHAAWMMSRLHNLSCYLQWSGLTHNAINAETCFVDPLDHSVSLLGGWWYAAKSGEKLKALPPQTVAIAPPSVFDKPVAHQSLDLSLIRATGREILGDATGMNLIRDTNIPKPVTEWVNGVSSGDAMRDYKIWSEDILAKSFGARRFVEMKLSPNDIYKP